MAKHHERGLCKTRTIIPGTSLSIRRWRAFGFSCGALVVGRPSSLWPCALDGGITGAPVVGSTHCLQQYCIVLGFWYLCLDFLWRVVTWILCSRISFKTQKIPQYTKAFVGPCRGVIEHLFDALYGHGPFWQGIRSSLYNFFYGAWCPVIVRIIKRD